MKIKFVKIILLCIVVLFMGLPLAWAEGVNVKIDWKYRNFPTQMKIYEVAQGQKLRLWLTKVVSSIKEVPVGPEINEGSLKVERGGKKKFVLVAENTTDKPIYFFAAPHQVSPVENALGFKFKCLCINFAYEIGPGQIWYRVVVFKVSPNFQGDSLTVTHPLVGVDANQMKLFGLPQKRPGL